MKLNEGRNVLFHLANTSHRPIRDSAKVVLQLVAHLSPLSTLELSACEVSY